MARSRARKKSRPQLNVMSQAVDNSYAYALMASMREQILYAFEGTFNTTLESLSEIFGDWVIGVGRFDSLRADRMVQGLPYWPEHGIVLGQEYDLDNGCGMRLVSRWLPEEDGIVMEIVHPLLAGHPILEGHLSDDSPKRERLKEMALAALRTEPESSRMGISLCHRVKIRRGGLDDPADARDQSKATIQYGLSCMRQGPKGRGGRVSWWAPKPWVPEFLWAARESFGEPEQRNSEAQKRIKEAVKAKNTNELVREVMAYLKGKGGTPRCPIILYKATLEKLDGGGFRSGIVGDRVQVLFEVLNRTIAMVGVNDEMWDAFAGALRRDYGRGQHVVDTLGLNSLVAIGVDEVRGTAAIIGRSWGRALFGDGFNQAVEEIAVQVGVLQSLFYIHRIKWDELDPSKIARGSAEAMDEENEIMDRLGGEWDEEDAEAERASFVAGMDQLQGKLVRSENLRAKAEDELAGSERRIAALQAKVSELDAAVAEARRRRDEAMAEAVAQDRTAQEELLRLKEALQLVGTEKDAAALVEMTTEQADEIHRLEETLRGVAQEKEAALEEARALKRRIIGLEGQLGELISRPAVTGNGCAQSEGRGEYMKAVLRGEPSVEEGLRFFQDAFPDRVIVLESAIRGARESSDFEFPARAFELLRKLVVDYYETLLAGGGDTKAREIFGKDGYAAVESESVEANTRAVALRTFTYKGKPMVMNRHLKIGYRPGSAETLRIHFHWDPEAKKLVIGWAGRHLDHR